MGFGGRFICVKWLHLKFQSSGWSLIPTIPWFRFYLGLRDCWSHLENKKMFYRSLSLIANQKYRKIPLQKVENRRLTCLSREASTRRLPRLMIKSRVISVVGWGPASSGAKVNLRTIIRTEFLMIQEGLKELLLNLKRERIGMSN